MPPSAFRCLPKLPRPGPEAVFNLEVHNEHVYFVGEDGVLVHNTGNGIYFDPNVSRFRDKTGQFVSREAASIHGSPSAKAAAFQGQGAYPGVDDWEDIVLPKGTVVYTGDLLTNDPLAGVSGFFTTPGAIRSAKGSKKALNEGLQIKAHATHGYRPGVGRYVTTEATPAARSLAVAQDQSTHGVGGLEQYFIPSYKTALKKTSTRRLK